MQPECAPNIASWSGGVEDVADSLPSVALTAIYIIMAF